LDIRAIIASWIMASLCSGLRSYIFGVAAAAVDPSNSTFDDPAFGQYDKAFHTDWP
jgi:hypothetical protein